MNHVSTRFNHRSTAINHSSRNKIILTSPRRLTKYFSVKIPRRWVSPNNIRAERSEQESDRETKQSTIKKQQTEKQCIKDSPICQVERRPMCPPAGVTAANPTPAITNRQNQILLDVTHSNTHENQHECTLIHLERFMRGWAKLLFE